VSPRAVPDDAAIQQFRTSLHGALLRPNDHGYGLINRRPALIARCSGVADVIAAVKFARAHGLLVAVRGGGHNVAGTAVCDGGLVIDLSGMKGLRVDPDRRTARAQPGLTMAEFDRETQAFGLATTAGMVSTTGIGGLTLGGGIGWLMRKHGLTCDNLRSADLVTAEGEFLKSSEDENADLFWGLRGGGGNFGIVTSFEYQLHPLGRVLTGRIVYPMAKARELLRFYREYTPTVPDELTSIVSLRICPALSIYPFEIHGTQIVSLLVCYAGPPEAGERVLRPLREFGSVIVDLVRPQPYCLHQTLFDAGVPAGILAYYKTQHLAALTDEVIDTVVDCSTRISSPQSNVLIYQLGGAMRRVGEDAMAYSHRDPAYTLELTTYWSDALESDEHVRWTREFWAAVRPLSTGGAFLNFLGDEGAAGVRAAFPPEKYERLVALKNKYDPTNFFRLNQNIKPTVPSGGAT
jgi:FAD/FMN-containing dehydrogenase